MKVYLREIPEAGDDRTNMNRTGDLTLPYHPTNSDPAVFVEDGTGQVFKLWQPNISQITYDEFILCGTHVGASGSQKPFVPYLWNCRPVIRV